MSELYPVEGQQLPQPRQHQCKTTVMKHLHVIENAAREIVREITAATPLASELVFTKRVEKLERAVWKLKSELSDLKL